MRFLIIVVVVAACLPLATAWGNLRNIWSKGDLTRKHFFTDSGSRIQFLATKKGGKYTCFYNTDSSSVMSRFNYTLRVTPKDFVVDLDIEEWKDQGCQMIAYYDAACSRYCVETDAFRLPVFSLSPVRRCFLWNENTALLGLVICCNGDLHLTNRTLDDIEEVSKFNVGFDVVLAEFMAPFLFLVDRHQTLYVYCPTIRHTIASYSIGNEIPITCFHPFATDDAFGFAMGFMNKTILLYTPTRKTTVHLPSVPKKVFMDYYKFVAVLEDGSSMVGDAQTGEIWFRLGKVCDPDYVTRLIATHRLLMIDGTRGLVVHDTEMNISPPHLPSLSRRLTKNDYMSPFMEALMRSPPSHGGKQIPRRIWNAMESINGSNTNNSTQKK